MLIIRHHEVREILHGAEAAVLDLVRETYRRHDEGATAVPHSTFLRFPGDRSNRIIGLPAYLGGERPTAGIKWVSSFPANLGAGLPRASAAILLNSMATGRPEALLEGAQISAARTAASAAAAAVTLLGDPARASSGAPSGPAGASPGPSGGPSGSGGVPVDPASPSGVSMIGCGLINFETLRYLAAALPAIPELTIFDSSPERAQEFAGRAAELLPRTRLTVAGSAGEAVAAHDLLSIATTAIEPHLALDGIRPGAVVLHISLRDIVPEAILAARNVVDDVDHAVRERTSLHLAEQRTGNRDFVHATLGGLLRGTVTLPSGTDSPVIFSPFGLGALDIALARYIESEARRRRRGVEVEDFLPVPEPARS